MPVSEPVALEVGCGASSSSPRRFGRLVRFAAPAAQAAAPSTGSVQVLVTGTATGGSFAGAYTITQFKTVSGARALYAVGTLTGTITNSADTVVNTLTNVPVYDPGQRSERQLQHPRPNPLHLDLLGLVVDLNQVHLTITAQQGSGNLLGNLLCDVANLLNSNNTTGLSGLLNQILGQL